MRFDSIQAQPKTGPDGKVNLQFTLPRLLDRGDVRLQVTFKSTVGREVVRKSSRIACRSWAGQVKVEFFPEGGDLVAGRACRVYFRATTPDGQAVDIRGTITDGRRTIAKVETLTDAIEGTNRGLGSFTFTPEIGTPVWLKLDAPYGVWRTLDSGQPDVSPAPVAAGGGLAAAATAPPVSFFLPS